MATANQIRFFVLSKNAGLQRVATKRKLSIDDLRKDGVPTTGQFYLYIRVKRRDPTATEDRNGQRRLLCFFDELKIDDDTITGRRGILHVRGTSAIALAMCIPLPADILLCNFGLATDPAMNDPNRINLFDIELEMDEDRSTNGELYNLEEPEVQPGFQLESTYSELKNITDGPKLSVYGVIKSIVELDNGNMKLTLTDPSLNVDKHVICHLASDITGVLPRRAKVGDVLRLHRVSAKSQHGVVKLFGRMGKGGLSWLLFDGRRGADLTPVSSSQTYSISEKDYETVRVLRSWFCINNQGPPTAAANQNNDPQALLKDFPLLTYRNVLLQVVGVFESNRSSQAVIIRGWDGTKCKRETVTVDPDKENLTVHSYDRDLREAVGDYVVDVFVYDQFRETARNLEHGQYVLLTNVHFLFQKPASSSFVLHGGAKANIYGRGIEELDATDNRLLELKRRLEDFISKLPSDKRERLAKRKNLVDDAETDDHSSAPVHNRRRNASLSPNFRTQESTAGTKTPPSSSSRNAGGSPPIRKQPTKAGPSTTSSSPCPKRTRRTTTSDTSTPPRSPDRQLRSNVVESPRSNRKNLVEALCRPALSQTSQRRSPRADNTPPPRRTSSNKSHRAARDDSSSDTPIYSQSSPVRIVRKQNAPAPELVSIAVETARVTVSERSPRRVLRNASAAPITPQNQRPKRSTAAKTFFEEDISDSSSEEPSSEESSSGDSDYEGRDDNNRRRGHMNLRSRSASTQGSPARSQKARPKQATPKSTKTTTRTPPRAKRGRKRL